MVESVTKLLEFERNRLWHMGRRLKCHTGRYGPLGRIVARRYAGRIVKLHWPYCEVALAILWRDIALAVMLRGVALAVL